MPPSWIRTLATVSERLLDVRVIPLVKTVDPFIHWIEVRWTSSGAEQVRTMLLPWTTVTGPVGETDNVSGGGGAVSE